MIGPEGGAWGGGAFGDAGEGAAGVDVLVVSSSRMDPNGTKCTKKVILGSNGVDRARSLRKILT